MRFLKARKGIMRVVEALFSAVIILMAVIVSSQIVVFPNPFTSRTRTDLEKLGYNLMFRLAQEGSLERLILEGGDDWENDACILFGTLLPVGVYFNLAVYYVNSVYMVNESSSILIYNVALQPLNDQPITNAENQDVFRKGGDVVSIEYVYTMEINGKIKTLLFVLQLTRGER